MAEHGGGGGVLRELIAVFGFGVDTDELKKGETQLDKFLEHIKKLAGGIAAAFAIHEISEFAEANVHAMSEIEHAAVRLGISSERVQQFQFAARELGLQADELTNSMGRLQVAQQAAAAGGQAQAAGFHAIGVNVKDANGHFKTADELMLDVAEGISKLKDPSKQASVAVALFGRQGRSLLPFLKEGREGFAELTAEFKELGGGYSEKAIEQSKKFEAQSAKTALATTSLKGRIMEQLLPALTWLSKITSSVIVWLRKMVEQSNVVRAVLVVLGAAGFVFGAQMVIAFAPLLLLGAAIAFVIGLVDDLITLFTGGDSEIGAIIDSIFGKGSSTAMVESLKAAWMATADALKTAYEYAKKFFEYLEEKGGAAGDALGKARNAVTEASYDADEVKAKARIRQRVEAAKVGGLYIAPGETVDQARAATTAAQYATQAQAALAPRIGGQPPAAPTTIIKGGDTTVNVTAPPGGDAKQLAAHIGHEVRKAQKQAHREAAATFQRASTK